MHYGPDTEINNIEGEDAQRFNGSEGVVATLI